MEGDDDLDNAAVDLLIPVALPDGSFGWKDAAHYSIGYMIKAVADEAILRTSGTAA